MLPAREQKGMASIPGAPTVSVARYELRTSGAPRFTGALDFAERVRRALLRNSDGADVFLGRDDAGRRLEGHRHTFYLPEANGHSEQVTHVTLFAPMGFDAAARRALFDLREVRGEHGRPFGSAGGPWLGSTAAREVNTWLAFTQTGCPLAPPRANLDQR